VPAANFGAARGLPFARHDLASRRNRLPQTKKPGLARRLPCQKADRRRPGETSNWFGENEASLKSADMAHDRGNEGQAAANLPHDAINNGEPETAAGADG
jgi:hypothetical protein